MSIEVDKAACTGCSYCVLVCSVRAIAMEIQARSWPVIDERTCTRCGDCLYICPNNVFSDATLVRPPVELEPEYDVVIIGAGIGGLITAAGLARAGKKVLVLEQLSFIGGKYTHLTYQGYAITTAAWTCPGPKSRIGRLCAKLGADIQWITIREVGRIGEMWILTRDGRRFPSTYAAMLELVGGKENLAQAYRWHADMYHPGRIHPDDMTTRQYIQLFVPDSPGLENFVETTTTSCFASQTLDTFPAMETKRAVVDAFEQRMDWGTARGGTSAIVEALAQVLRQNGGKIVTHTKVDSLQIENGKAAGVTLGDGRFISAGVVVHNAGLNRLLALAGEENLPAEYVARLRSVVPARVAALILGLKEDLLGPDHSLLSTMGWERILNCYAPTFFNPDLAPEDRRLLDVFWVMQPPYDQKRELEIVLEQLRQIFPRFDEMVELKVPMFFTGQWTAEMAQCMGQSGDQRLDPRSPIENLYLVGADCIGYGIAGDIIPHSVERVLFQITGDPVYTPEDGKISVRLNRWLKAQIIEGMALVKRLTG